MGLSDTREMLEVAKTDNAQLQNAMTQVRAVAKQRLSAEHVTIADATYWADVYRITTAAIEWRNL